MFCFLFHKYHLIYVKIMIKTGFWHFLDFSVKKTIPIMSLILIIFGLASCSSNTHRAPVSRLAQPESLKIHYHTVSAGDTLYSIAWRYNLDYKNLSKINKIKYPYNIFPGQRISLKGVAKRAKYVAPAPTAVTKKRTERLPKRTVKASAPAPKPSPKPKKRLKKKTVKAPKVKSMSPSSSPLVWAWPVRGSVVGTFKSGKGLNKGIDIAAKLGESVRAAADGEVVYAGSGLRGYGKLLIIKHKSSYLSAYAHNRSLNSKEGDRVKKGQKIAEVGGSGTTSVKLHFEIRRDGTPINPLSVLPK